MVNFLHLHTHFFFAFAIDRELVAREHGDQWQSNSWIGGLDKWIASHNHPGKSALVDRLGPWQRAAYTTYDLDSRAYQDMVFFHPYVRHVFFDTIGPNSNAGGEWESLIRCYSIADCKDRLFLRAEDGRDGHPDLGVTDLRLFLFANGMGILGIGVEAFHIPSAEALWVNEMVRKVYPSSGRQGREGRAVNKMSLRVRQNGSDTALVEETFQDARLRGFQPPLSSIVTSLLYFLDYDKQEYEQLLDERMITYSYGALDPQSCPPDFIESEQYEVLLSHFLYVDREEPNFRYQREFITNKMKHDVYRRWAHQGTYYGFTGYSSIALTLGVADKGHHSLKEGFLIHRMFDTRYYLMTVIALFYRATLLDFAEKSALVSKRLFSEQERGHLSRENIELAHSVRSEFLHFTNYWYFEELANKEEESEHFTMQCRAYRLAEMKIEIEEELGKMNSSLQEYYQNRNTDAVNRLAMLSMILGAGAVITGFFGMNFGQRFAEVFFEPKESHTVHNFAIAFVSLLSFLAISAVAYLIGSNWQDYKDIFKPKKERGLVRPTWNTVRDPSKENNP